MTPDATTHRAQDQAEGPDRHPAGTLGGQPVNADETAPREVVPDPHGAATRPDRRDDDAVDDQPGSDL